LVVGAAVTVYTDVMTVGTQVEIVTVDRIGAVVAGLVGAVVGLMGPPGWMDEIGAVEGVSTGQTVVEVMTEVVLLPTGQFVTVGAQDVMVYSTVE